MKYASIDESALPLITIRFAGFEPNVEQFEAYLADMEAMYARNKTFAIVFDATDAKYLNSDLRILQGKWLKAHKETIRQKCLGHAYVVPTAMLQFLLKAIFLVQPPFVPHKVCSSAEDAHAWAEGMLAQATNHS